jgi:hypothetical protein
MLTRSRATPLLNAAGAIGSVEPFSTSRAAGAAGPREMRIGTRAYRARGAGGLATRTRTETAAGRKVSEAEETGDAASNLDGDSAGAVKNAGAKVGPSRNRRDDHSRLHFLGKLRSLKAIVAIYRNAHTRLRARSRARPSWSFMMKTKSHKRERVGDSAGSQPRTDRKVYARSRLTNGKDLLPDIDGRSLIARRYRDIYSAIVADQGGFDQLSEARLQLIRRFAACCVLAEKMESQLARGEQIDIIVYAQLTSTMVRVAQRIGLDRVPRDISSPSLADILRGAWQ